MSLLHKCLQPLQEVHLCQVLLIPLGGLLCPVDAPLQHFNVREDQLQVDGFNVPCRVDLSVHMNDVDIFKASYHMYNGIHLPDICQELVAQSLPLGGSLYQPGNVHEFQSCRGELFRMIHFRQLIQPLIRHRYDANILLDGAKGVICRLRSCIGQGVEQCTFSHVGKTNHT